MLYLHAVIVCKLLSQIIALLILTLNY